MNTDLAVIIQQHGWVPALAIVFVWGLAMNLTPCVYPMIPITISYFGGSGGESSSRGTALLRAVLFVLGMAITYSFLGVSAALTGKIFGASLGNPYVVGFVSVVMVLMALSMFGVFQMTAPSGWLSGIQETRDRLGWLGALFFGLVIGIVMAPCVGPFITALLVYVGAQHDPMIGFLLFFTLAVGMGSPYIVLGFFTSALKSMPRPDTWMLWLERFFGFVLIGYAYSLWIPLISNTVVAKGVLAVYLLAAAAVLGFIATPGARPGFRFVKVVLIGGFLVIAGMVGFDIQQALNPPPAPPVASGSGAPTAPTAVQWHPYSEEALKAAQAAGKPVMIDFYAKWCAACKELDEKTYIDPTVIAATQDIVCLKADFTKVEDVDSDPTAKRFEIKGLPTVVFIGRDGKELKDLRVMEFIPPATMLTELQKAVSAK